MEDPVNVALDVEVVGDVTAESETVVGEWAGEISTSPVNSESKHRTSQPSERSRSQSTRAKQTCPAGHQRAWHVRWSLRRSSGPSRGR